MPKSVHITTPYPTFEEVARRLRIPKRRQKEIRAMADEFIKQLDEDEKSPASKITEREEKRKDASAAD
jgi:hypothetical protein